MIPDSFKQDLLNRVDIVDVVSRYVQLKKGGANYLGLCPFHNEKTPSFTVSPAKQFYHCFGCGVHGNAIGFLMAYGAMGYVDAIKELDPMVGVYQKACPDLVDIVEAGDADTPATEGAFSIETAHDDIRNVLVADDQLAKLQAQHQGLD